MKGRKKNTRKDCFQCALLFKSTEATYQHRSVQFSRSKWRLTHMSSSDGRTWHVNWLCIMARLWTPLETNATSVLSLSFTFLQLFLAIILAFTAGRKLPSLEKWIITWLLYDAMTHFTLVGVNFGTIYDFVQIMDGRE